MRLRGRWETPWAQARLAGCGPALLERGALTPGKPEGTRAAEMAIAQEETGKPIWIRARWISTRGEPGPWSLAQNTVIA